MMPSASEQRKLNISLLFEWSKAYEMKNDSPVTFTILMRKAREIFEYRFTRMATRKSYCYAVMDLMRLERLKERRD